MDMKKHSVLSRHNKMNNRGAAMIVVVCVMAVVMILSLTLLMAAYQMLATVSDEGRDELYYQQAMSFSKVLQKRLEDRPAGISDDLVDHIDDFMSADMYKDVDKEKLTADAPTSGGAYGGITLLLDKVSSHGNLVVTITVDNGKKAMASCKCKFEVKEEGGLLKYTFQGYY